MRNPVDHIMEHAGVNDREFSLAIGVPHVVVWRARKGMTKTINPEILTALEELGYDPAIIQAEYQKWRDVQKMELQQRLTR